MKLKSFGCSFIFGTDLSDDGRNGKYATGSYLTWPALVAKKLDAQYKTYSRAGAGNQQILEKLLNQITDDDTVYVIGWTWIDRFDYIDPELITPWPGTKWKTLQPIHKGEPAKTYYKYLHSEYADKFSSLCYIKMAIDCLKQKNCRFIMTCMDDLIFCERWHVSKATRDILTYVKPYINNFEGQTFLNWSRSKGFEISDTLHPLEPAHEAAAELVFQNISDYIKQ